MYIHLIPRKYHFRKINKDYERLQKFDFSGEYYITSGSFWSVSCQVTHFQILMGSKYLLIAWSETNTLAMSNPISCLLDKSVLEGTIWKPWRHEQLDLFTSGPLMVFGFHVFSRIDILIGTPWSFLIGYHKIYFPKPNRLSSGLFLIEYKDTLHTQEQNF